MKVTYTIDKGRVAVQTFGTLSSCQHPNRRAQYFIKDGYFLTSDSCKDEQKGEKWYKIKKIIGEILEKS